MSVHALLVTRRLTFYLRHYSYECRGTLQDRPYASRPSRTQQFRNPKLAPRLNSENPNELLARYKSRLHPASLLTSRKAKVWQTRSLRRQKPTGMSMKGDQGVRTVPISHHVQRAPNLHHQLILFQPFPPIAPVQNLNRHFVDD